MPSLECYLIGEARIDIQPANKRRDWMDATSGSFAYRCLPLTMANTHGWEIRCLSGFEAEWNGGDRPEDVRVIADPGAESDPDGQPHFGHGILSFGHEVIFRTSRGLNLWVSGPANSFKDAIQPLSGLVEADWMPFTFSMNWKFTRPHTRIRFEKGEPYCQIFAVPRGLVRSLDPVMGHVEDHPELKHQYDVGKRKREFRRVVEGLRPGYVAPAKLRFQGWYARGVLPDESAVIDGHELPQQAKPFLGKEDDGERV